MKKLLLSIVAALFILSGCNKTKQFKVTVNLDNADGQTVYLAKVVDGKDVIMDSAVIEGKTAVLKADYDDPQRYYYIEFTQNAQCDAFPFFTENQNTTITGESMDEMQYWVAKGCATMDLYNSFNDITRPMGEPLDAIIKEMEQAYANDDTIKGKELYLQGMEMMEQYIADYNEVLAEFVKNHSDSYLSHYLLNKAKDDMDFALLKELANGFTTESVYRNELDEYISTNEKYQVGQPFIDFTLQTVDGKDINLAETIKNNKVTMIDFWASWCGPCRGENPYVKAAYEKYHAKGFEIIGVSVDRNEAAWLQAVEEDALPYIQVRDANYEAGSLYAVQFIPSNFLFDQDGNIIAKGLRGEQLEEKLAEVLE